MDVEQLHARRLLSNAAVAVSPGPAGQVDEGGGGAPHSAAISSLDAMAITILSLLLCALVVGLVLHAFVRCAFRVTRRMCYGQEPPGAEASGERAALAGAEGAGARRTGKGGAIRALPTMVYSAEIELAICGMRSTECAICLAEFAQGERVRVLPRCNHGFHVRCIDRWLSAHQTCPTCRRVPFAKPDMSTRAEAEVESPAAVQLQVHADAGQPETL